MKKKSASKSAFFNLRVLIGLGIALAGISLALLGLDAFPAYRAPVEIRNHIIIASNDALVRLSDDVRLLSSKVDQLAQAGNNSDSFARECSCRYRALLVCQSPRW